MKTIKLLLLLFFVGNSYLHAQKITGKVSSSKKGLHAVKVYLKGTAKESTTDKSGLFTIENVEPGTYTIVASYDGYKNVEKEITVEGHVTIIRLVLKEDES
ncbi:carboxypeptidase-like regulatory domain-containing protein [Seonamhaeicola marinus]|uniref:Carboxypeptidase-like regulatory domain-containing protein n=1 Tax=Seonamhaeicola marinus TaxID=1912246 RepID=A0A5D0HV08_9FLAO|nr:carboxypeptidase-like regulatory domain-containing protein [Seonamhaeicola marinus]TYA73977.1 carboxypeptidase-like regulatory domain-containing protein [Seonamhaeicola marinus]